jgi:hypothetical protein
LKPRIYLALWALGLALVLLAAAFQSVPGYMDAEYYYAGGLRLAEGSGFSEPFLWNYLNDPVGLPTPSHTYWMPLASILAALGQACCRHLQPGLAVASSIVNAALSWQDCSRVFLDFMRSTQV